MNAVTIGCAVGTHVWERIENNGWWFENSVILCIPDS